MKLTKFPRVFVQVIRGLSGRSEKKILIVVYKNRVETYQLFNSETKSDIDKSNGEDVCYDYESIYGKGWNAYHEINLLVNNGGREVHAGQEYEVD